jgi:hypothetical protein
LHFWSGTICRTIGRLGVDDENFSLSFQIAATLTATMREGSSTRYLAVLHHVCCERSTSDSSQQVHGSPSNASFFRLHSGNNPPPFCAHRLAQVHTTLNPPHGVLIPPKNCSLSPLQRRGKDRRITLPRGLLSVLPFLTTTKATFADSYQIFRFFSSVSLWYRISRFSFVDPRVQFALTV